MIGDFSEFYPRHYRQMPSDFYPELWTEKEGDYLVRRSENFGYFIDGPDYGGEANSASRALGDEQLRALEWNRAEMMRISKLAGIA